MNKIAILYKYLFARKLFYPVHRLMFSVSTRGLGILNYENPTLSGEKFLFKSLASKRWKEFVVIDVGANIGCYSCALKKVISSAKIYAIEPHPKTFIELEKQANDFGYHAYNVAFSDSSSTVTIFDYAVSDSDKDHNDYSTHASLYKEALPHKDRKNLEQYNVQAITLDQFIVEQNIDRINLLKIDVEGHELKVLLGASTAIKLNKIDLIQFEFNSMNRSSRVYMKDFFEILEGYKLYRLMQDFLAPIQIENALLSELFSYQNIIAIRKGFDFD